MALPVATMATAAGLDQLVHVPVTIVSLLGSSLTTDFSPAAMQRAGPVLTGIRTMAETTAWSDARFALWTFLQLLPCSALCQYLRAHDGHEMLITHCRVRRVM